ncbi:MAG TPA: hypothetical protein VHJ38_04190 [Nitrososphaeraceae archaeon]|nr:hypothetical protein [Nitrososphaeraceae archaeon]
MLDKKLGIFSPLLFFGVAALFLPATALQNSIANAQEYYNEEYEENGYYNQEYDPYKKDNNKNAPIVNVEKNLFVCNDVNGIPDNLTDDGVFIRCANPANFFFLAGPDSGEYKPCDDETCPFIDESDFGVQIFKDVATVLELSPEGTSVNLDKFHYTVTEGDIDQRITTDFECSAVGFDDSNFFITLLEDGTEVGAFICVNYVGDCEGIIYSDEVKTCTIENYIADIRFFPPPSEDDNTADNAQSSLQQSNNQAIQSNNQAIQSQSHTLRDIFSDRTN